MARVADGERGPAKKIWDVKKHRSEEENVLVQMVVGLMDAEISESRVLGFESHLKHK